MAQAPAAAPELVQAEQSLAEATILYAEILKAAGQAHAAGKLSDRQVGAIRAAGRQTELELQIARSVVDLYRLGFVKRPRLAKAMADLRLSISRLQKLWVQHGLGRGGHG